MPKAIDARCRRKKSAHIDKVSVAKLMVKAVVDESCSLLYSVANRKPMKFITV